MTALNDIDGVKYRVYQFLGRPIFAVPMTPRRLRLAALKRYQPATQKRRVYRQFMRLLMFLRADRLVASTVDIPIDLERAFDFHDWMNGIRKDLGKDYTFGAVYWPPQRDRGRVYVHLFDKYLKPVGFAKVSLDEHNDQCLFQEAQSLVELSKKESYLWHVPYVLSVGEVSGHAFVILEPIPESAAPLGFTMHAYPAKCVSEFSGDLHLVRRDEIVRLSWWDEYLRSCDETCVMFNKELIEMVSDGVYVCRTHGDFGPCNLVQDNGRLWIYDWEESKPDGPALTDEISFYLGVSRPQTSVNPIKSLHRFSQHYLSDASPQRRANIMMALAYRHSVGIEDATFFIQNWNLQL